MHSYYTVNHKSAEEATDREHFSVNSTQPSEHKCCSVISYMSKLNIINEEAPVIMRSFDMEYRSINYRHLSDGPRAVPNKVVPEFHSPLACIHN